MTKTHKFIFVICVILGVSFLSSLGAWQVKRLAWKTDLIYQIERAQSEPAIDLSTFIPLGNADEYKYHPARAKGVFIQNTMRYLVPRIYQGKAGGHLIQVARIKPSNQFLFVNLGWVDQAVDVDYFNKRDFFNGVGYLRSPSKKDYFQPENKSFSRDIYWLDLETLISEMQLEEDQVFPFIFYQTTNSHEAIIPHDMNIEIRNKHLYYACFWFVMAFIFAVFSAYAFYKQEK